MSPVENYPTDAGQSAQLDIQQGATAAQSTLDLGTPKVLEVVLKLKQYPILSRQIRKRMRDEIFARGVITEEDFEREVRDKSIESQTREGLHDPFEEEAPDVLVMQLRPGAPAERAVDALLAEGGQLARDPDAVLEPEAHADRRERLRLRAAVLRLGGADGGGRLRKRTFPRPRRLGRDGGDRLRGGSQEDTDRQNGMSTHIHMESGSPRSCPVPGKLSSRRVLESMNGG